MIIIAVLALIAFIRTVGYGVYTLRMKNICGAVSLFVLALMCAATSVIFFGFLLTNML